MKFFKKNSGLEIIPNIDFWKSLPSDIKVKQINKTLILNKNEMRPIFCYYLCNQADEI